MQIAIADRDRTPFWSVPGTAILLTYENPGPVDVDPAVLTLAQKNIIARALNNRVIVGKNLEGLVPQEQPKVQQQPVQITPVATISETPQEMIQRVTAQRNEKLVTLLNKTLATIKKELPALSLSELRSARDLEIANKNRASVIKVMNSLLAKQASNIDKNISNNTSKVKVAQELSLVDKDSKKNVEFLGESNVEEVEIKLGTDEEEGEPLA